MAGIHDPSGHHDWNSRGYVRNWAERQDRREEERLSQFQLLTTLLPFEKDAPIRFLDLGAGYGALTQFLLSYFPNAVALCHDGSSEMSRLGHERMAVLKGRFSYVISDFSKKGWSKEIEGGLEAVVSCNAIHNVRIPDVIRNIYAEAFELMRDGGCFFNLDRRFAEKHQVQWLKEAGFKNAKCFERGKALSLYGGFKR